MDIQRSTVINLLVPPWHKLYKAPSKVPTKKVYKDNWKCKKVLGDANFIEGNNTEVKPPETATETPSLFTPGQYAEILKLLGVNNTENECTQW